MSWLACRGEMHNTSARFFTRHFSSSFQSSSSKSRCSLKQCDLHRPALHMFRRAFARATSKVGNGRRKLRNHTASHVVRQGGAPVSHRW